MFKCIQINICFGVKNSGRFVRARWERPFLKDLYHRRMIAGADPLISRAAFPNWDYEAELFAFSHRIEAPEINLDILIQSLTDKTFFTRADVSAESANAQPSNQYDYDSFGHNEQFVENGSNFLWDSVCAMLRFGMPKVPEELVIVLGRKLLDEKQLAKLASYLGINHLIRTGEFPPSHHSLSRAVKALIGAMSYDRGITLIKNVIMPQLNDIDIEEAFPLAEPFNIVQCLLSKTGVREIEPRILRSSGEISAEPIFIVGIYADRNLVGEAPGETISIAVDMASLDTLFRMWGLTSENKFPFNDLNECFDLKKHQTPNISLSSSIELKFVDEIEPPLDLKSVALQYKTQVEAIVGRPLRRRLRHKFSRGTWGKRYFRYVMKPRVYTIC